jgi:hypothetical protein
MTLIDLKALAYHARRLFPYVTQVAELSERCRAANAACIVVKDAALLGGIATEQQLAKGSFPGPRPVVYRPDLESSSTAGGVDGAFQAAILHGADALVVPLSFGLDGTLDSVKLATVTRLATAAQGLGVTILPELAVINGDGCDTPIDEEPNAGGQLGEEAAGALLLVVAK